MEYFNSLNVYNNIGYMPEEYYRLGVVFVYNDDTYSSVYNLRGCAFKTLGEVNCIPSIDIDQRIDTQNLFLSENSENNTKGVFKMPYVDLMSSINSVNKQISPIVLKFTLYGPDMEMLKNELNIKGYFYVRQPRIPVFLAQGYSLGVSKTAYIPMLMGTGGNSGSQSSVTVIRGLSVGELDVKDVFSVLWKEIRVSVLCGVSLAVACFVKIILIDGMLLNTAGVTHTVALVVALTLCATVICAKVIGAILPLGAKILKLDPAVMASPFITTIVDAVSLLVYFGIAKTFISSI
jgi:hypothetical protein